MGNAVKKITKPITNLFDITPPKPKVPSIVQQAAAPVAPAVQEVVDTGGEAASRAASPVQEAAEEEIRRRRAGRGRASTIITALEGQLPAGSVVRKALLGA